MRTGISILHGHLLTHLHSIFWRRLSTLVNAHGHVHLFRAILVAHKDAVFSRISHHDVVDRDGAALVLPGDGKLAVVGDLLVALEPDDLRIRRAIDKARQTQRLSKGCDGKDTRKVQLWSVKGPGLSVNRRFLTVHTFPSMMATASGIPFNTLARSGGEERTLTCLLPWFLFLYIEMINNL